MRLFLSRTRGSGLKQVTGLPWRYMLSGFSHFWYFATPWTLAHEAALSMGFSRQEYWNGLPRPSLGDLPNPGIESMSLMSPALAGRFFTTSTTWEALVGLWIRINLLMQGRTQFINRVSGFSPWSRNIPHFME